MECWVVWFGLKKLFLFHNLKNVFKNIFIFIIKFPLAISGIGWHVVCQFVFLVSVFESEKICKLSFGFFLDFSNIPILINNNFQTINALTLLICIIF